VLTNAQMPSGDRGAFFVSASPNWETTDSTGALADLRTYSMRWPGHSQVIAGTTAQELKSAPAQENSYDPGYHR
jgi:hypothetical protein